MVSEWLKSFLIRRGSIFTVTGTLGFIANICQVVFVCRDKRQTRSVFGTTLLSLSISDIFVSIVLLFRGCNIFLGIFSVYDQSKLNQLGAWTNPALLFSFASSFSHVVFIGVLRAFSIVFPLKINQIFTHFRCKIILALLWVESISLTLFAYFIAGNILFAYLAITTSCLLILAYSFICYTKYKLNAIQNNEQMQRHGQESDKDVLIYSITLTFIFCLCTLPEALSFFIKYPLLLKYIDVFLYSINPFLDTMLYFFSSFCKQRRERNNLRKREEHCLSQSNSARIAYRAESQETVI